MEFFGRFKIAHPQKAISGIKADAAIFFEVYDGPLFGDAVKGKAGNFKLPHRVAKGTAAIGFFDAARQRAFATHAGAVGVGKAGTGQWSS